MLVYKSCLFSMPAEGKLDLQIGTIFYTDDYNGEREMPIDLPDDWFIFIRFPHRLTCGKESGFLYFSKIGYEENKEKIKESFIRSKSTRGTWEDFEKYAEKFYADVKKNTNREILNLQKKIKDLEAKIHLV